MNSTVKVTTGKQTKTFEISISNLDRFIAGMQDIANETHVAAAYEVEHCRRGVIAKGCIFPEVA